MKKFNIGIQLYSLRESMKENTFATLEKVKEMGYDCVEFAGYFDIAPVDLRKKLDELGLRAISTHTGISAVETPDALASTVAYHVALGCGYMAFPSLPEIKRPGNAEYPQTIKTITATCAAFKKAGLQLLYHNHDFEFNKINDQYMIDILYKDNPCLGTEFDVCWVRFAGVDPAAYIRKYANRCPVVHLKDFVCDEIAKGDPVYDLIDDPTAKKSPSRNGFEFRPIGHGVQDIPSIIKAAEESGTNTFIVEQDSTTGITPMEAARLSREYLKSIGL